MTKKQRSPSYCRRKGHSFERWVANQLKTIFPDAKRHLEYQACEANGVDVVGTHPYLVQCKRNKAYAPITAIKEVQVCPIEGGVPILVTKGDNMEPMAVLPFDELLRLIRLEKQNGR